MHQRHHPPAFHASTAQLWMPSTSPSFRKAEATSSVPSTTSRRAFNAAGASAPPLPLLSLPGPKAASGADCKLSSSLMRSAQTRGRNACMSTALGGLRGSCRCWSLCVSIPDQEQAASQRSLSIGRDAWQGVYIASAAPCIAQTLIVTCLRGGCSA